MSLWIPVFILFGYPLVYIAVPHLLLKGRVWQFFLVIIIWGGVGIFINAGFRTYLYVPLQEAIGFNFIPSKGFQPHSYLCMTTSVASPMIIRFFKLWTMKQKAWMETRQQQIITELQMVKAQVQPLFLFNSLNNIHSFAEKRSPKTPGLIIKLSSLLSYMLYDCKSEEVLMEKEVETIKNYIELEKERYGTRIDISVNIEGDIKGKFIAPLLILPFLENAFKHGTSDGIERPWMSIDIAVKEHLLHYKIVNSKKESDAFQRYGDGMENVKKRLQFLYPGKHELRITDQVDFFVVSLQIDLDRDPVLMKVEPFLKRKQDIPSYEIALSSGR